MGWFKRDFSFHVSSHPVLFQHTLTALNHEVNNAVSQPGVRWYLTASTTQADTKTLIAMCHCTKITLSFLHVTAWQRPYAWPTALHTHNEARCTVLTIAHSTPMSIRYNERQFYRFRLRHAITWCFSDRASWIDCILITNLMHWLLFIHKILYSSTCFEP